MKSLLTLSAAALFSGAVLLMPAVPAQAQANSKILVIYGNDPCPTSNGEEIVVCARKPESERYRIPEELRGTGRAQPESWAERAQALEYVGRSGTDSCTPDGSGGWTGCWQKLMRQYRQDRQAQKEEEPVLP